MKMIVRRYYKKGFPYKYTINKKYLKKLREEKGEEEASRIDNASYEIILTTKEEQRKWFFECLYRVRCNPRFYLDNLDLLCEFKVNIRDIFSNKTKDL